MRVVVIGGGVVGLCCAFELVREGAEVVVLDRDAGRPAASLSNAGWVVPALCQPLSGPGVLTHAARQSFGPHASFAVHPRPSGDLLRWCLRFVRQAPPARHRAGVQAMLGLGARSVEMFDDLRVAGVDFEMHAAGLILAAHSETGTREAVDLVEQARRAGYPGTFSVQTGAQLRRLEPALGDDVHGGVHAEAERHVAPASLVAGLRTSLHDKGVEIRDAADVLGVQPGGQRGDWEVITTRGPVTAGRVVIAAGVWSARLLRGLGAPIPLEPGKGYSIIATGTGTAPRHPMKLIEANIACSPFAEGLRLSGMFELGAYSPEVQPRLLRRIIDAAADYLRDWRIDTVAAMFAGLRPCTPDTLPLIGAVPGQPGIYAATGHGTLGVTLAPATARALTPLVLHGGQRSELDPFALDRFGRRPVRSSRAQHEPGTARASGKGRG